MTTTQTLVLDAGLKPHMVVSWRDAAELLYKGSAEIVELYDEVFRVISREVAKMLPMCEEMRTWFDLGGIEDENSDMLVVRMPAVIRLVSVLGRKNKVKFSRINVLTRDRFRCQYCGKRKQVSELNYDHVVPRGQGGKTCWENIVMACAGPDGCNARKGNRTPEQAGMTLLSKPVRPKSLPIAALRMDKIKQIPELWESWLYWNVELEP